jgi:hypothetical protein
MFNDINLSKDLGREFKANVKESVMDGVEF